MVSLTLGIMKKYLSFQKKKKNEENMVWTGSHLQQEERCRGIIGKGDLHKISYEESNFRLSAGSL